jgi:flagellar hook-associated protein 3 FlgL
MRISTTATFLNASHSLNSRQGELAKLSAQISSGRRIITPADDPAGAARVIELESARARNEQIGVNQRSAANTLSQAESLLGNISDAYSDIRELLVQAGNPALSDGDRKSLATELSARREALYGLSTSRDGDGQPLFGGRVVQVGSSRDLDVTLNNTLLFGQVRNGNGIFATAEAPTNSGGAAISAGTVSDASALDGGSYDIVIRDTAGTLTYDIVNAATSAVVSSANAFTAGGEISVAGMGVKISGVPAAGDTFHLTPSTARPVFDGWRPTSRPGWRKSTVPRKPRCSRAPAPAPPSRNWTRCRRWPPPRTSNCRYSLRAYATWITRWRRRSSRSANW